MQHADSLPNQDLLIQFLRPYRISLTFSLVIGKITFLISSNIALHGNRLTHGRLTEPMKELDLPLAKDKLLLNPFRVRRWKKPSA